MRSSQIEGSRPLHHPDPAVDAQWFSVFCRHTVCRLRRRSEARRPWPQVDLSIVFYLAPMMPMAMSPVDEKNDSNTLCCNDIVTAIPCSFGPSHRRSLTEETTVVAKVGFLLQSVRYKNLSLGDTKSLQTSECSSPSSYRGRWQLAGAQSRCHVVLEIAAASWFVDRRIQLQQ